MTTEFLFSTFLRSCFAQPDLTGGLRVGLRGAEYIYAEYTHEQTLDKSSLDLNISCALGNKNKINSFLENISYSFLLNLRHNS
jgi:hypothetical protein